MRYFLYCFALLTPVWAQEFRTTLLPVLEKAGCRTCHFADGVASATRLQFPESDAPPVKLDAFGRSLVELVDRADPAAPFISDR